MRLTLSTAVALVLLSVVTTTARSKNVTGTYTVAGTNCTITAKLDGGATGSGATEINRKDAMTCGLIKADGSFDATKFQANPDGSIKMSSFKQADGTVVMYGVTKPIDIEIPGDDGVKCKVSIPVTVIADKTKAGSNLVGRDWGAAAKVTETWANDKSTWPNNAASETGDKKVKTATDSSPVTPSSPTSKLLNDILYRTTSGANLNQSTFVVLGSPVTMISSSLASSLGLKATGQMDLSGDTSLLSELTKLGFYADSAPNYGLFGTTTVSSLTLRTDDGTPVTASNVAVLINPDSASSFFGRDMFLNDLNMLNGSPITDAGYVQETEQFSFSSVPEPSSLALVGVAGLCAAIFGCYRRGK